MNIRLNTLIKSLKKAIVNNPNAQRAVYLGTEFGGVGFRSQTYSWTTDDNGIACDIDGISAISVHGKEVAFCEWSFNEDGVVALDFFKEPNDNTRIYLA